MSEPNIDTYCRFQWFKFTTLTPQEKRNLQLMAIEERKRKEKAQENEKIYTEPIEIITIPIEVDQSKYKIKLEDLQLTEQQYRVFDLLSLNNKDIAMILNISPGYVRQIKYKLVLRLSEGGFLNPIDYKDGSTLNALMSFYEEVRKQ